ncbi:hypothetical protein K438DRAFT_1552338, partial [Mycena galopus ATCC 62051]
AKPKFKKDVKTKEFSHTFEGTEDNYLTLLKTILSKHGEAQYNFTKKMTYCIKVQMPGRKKGEALDIDDVDEYKDLVKEIVEEVSVKITIYVDMAEIQKKWSRRGGQENSNDEDVHGDNPSLFDSNGLSELDRSLAHFRGVLEKKYQNDHNSGYTYIDPTTAASYPLTLQMMKEWSRAMYDGEATRDVPPAHLGLGAVNGPRSAALHPSRIAAGVNSSQGSSDIAHLATIITSIMGAKTEDQVPHTPPKRRKTQEDIATSPVIPTPSKLPRYLDHASTNLGVPTARTFESPMRRNGFGPDILHMLPDDDLMGMGMSKGDAIRLKAGAQNWWNGPDAKKKRNVNTTPPSQKVTFERRWDEGGAMRFYG